MEFPSPVIGAGDSSLGELFPTIIPEPERYVWEAVAGAAGYRGLGATNQLPPDEPPSPPELAITFGEASQLGVVLPASFNQAPLLSFYADQRAGQPAIPVIRGWPAYPGVLPAIGVAVGTDQTDDQHEQLDGGFAGAVSHTDPLSGAVLATADYYSEPLYAQVIVQLVHENRDERDRLHSQLRRVLFSLRRTLLDRDRLIRRVRVDGEKQELPVDERPIVLYLSIFTVHVYYEMLEAVNVAGPDALISTVQPVLSVGTPGPAPDTDIVTGNLPNGQPPTAVDPSGNFTTFTYPYTD